MMVCKCLKTLPLSIGVCLFGKTVILQLGFFCLALCGSLPTTRILYRLRIVSGRGWAFQQGIEFEDREGGDGGTF